MSMSLKKIVLYLVITIGLTACDKKQPSSEDLNNGNVEKSWTERIAAGEQMIVTSRWDNAEVKWGKLRDSIKSSAQREAWVALQSRILEGTRSDPLKEELRESAIQEMYWYPEEARAYREWLSNSIESGLLSEPFVKEKASELLRILTSENTLNSQNR